MIAKSFIFYYQAQQVKIKAPPLLQLDIKQLNLFIFNKFNLQLSGNLSAIFNKLNFYNDNNKLNGFVLPADFI